MGCAGLRIGRAVAREFAGRGDRVGLIARGRTGLEAAAHELRALGGESLVAPADMSDHTAVRAAADAIESWFGPIDIWVNVAFTSVFAPFTDIRPEKFRRVTDVSYLGFVNGTREALSRMMPRDRGTIVQVGSALGERSIPLQSAYCGAKHAVNGFTSSVRTELMHQRSNVHITLVQMPAVNTPQFSWVLSRLPKHPQPVAPIYQPEVAARAVVNAADHPQRKQYYVGASTVATLLGNKVAAGLLDRYLARTGYAAQQTDTSVPHGRAGNLWQPLDGEGADAHDFGAHGIFDDRSHTRSGQAWLSRHARLTWSATALITAAAAAAAVRASRRHGPPAGAGRCGPSRPSVLVNARCDSPQVHS